MGKGDYLSFFGLLLVLTLILHGQFGKSIQQTDRFTVKSPKIDTLQLVFKRDARAVIVVNAHGLDEHFDTNYQMIHAFVLYFGHGPNFFQDWLQFLGFLFYVYVSFEAHICQHFAIEIFEK